MVASLTSNRSSNKPRVKAQSPPNVSIHERDPNTRDYFNFTRGDIWINLGTTAQPVLRVWILMRQAANVATWILLASNANGDVSQLTASDGTIALPVLGNITFPDQVIAGSGNIDSNLQSNVNPNLGMNFTLNLKPAIRLPVTNTALTEGVIYLGVNRFMHSFEPTNTFLGRNAGNGTLNAAAARFNSGVGDTALTALTTGASNIAVGRLALASNTTGNANNAIGDSALFANVSGSDNVAIGHSAMQNSNSSANNIAIGTTAMLVASAASFNIAIGTQALSSNATGSNNTAIGYQALALSTVSNNTAIGFEAAETLTTGNFNTCVGIQSLQLATTAANNKAFGYQALINLTTGSNNIAIGDGAGTNYTGAESSNILIDNNGVLGESNTLRIGESGGGATQQNRCFIAGIRGITTGVADAIAVLIDSADQLGTVSSSIKYKQNVRDMGDESSILMKLRPVVFNYRHHPEVPAWGLIAEEVETVFPQLVVYKNDEPETVKYHELVPLMLNEIQKLNKRISILEREICDQKVL